MPNLLYQNPHISYPVTNKNFSDYISQCRTVIANYRVDLKDNPLADLIIETNTPFELRPKNQKQKYGALLIHGLFDSPFVLKDIGKELCEANMLVRAVLLPGHGTVPGALLDVRWEEWFATVTYAIRTLLAEVDHVYLVGFSTGASLALLYALQNSAAQHIAGLILLSPAIKIKSHFDFAANWHRAISWIWERAAWLYITEEVDYAKYQSICFNSAYQVYRLIQTIKNSSHLLNHRMLMILSKDDTTVCADASINFFQAHANRGDKLIIYGENSKLTDPRIEVRESCYPSMNIKNFSHVAIPTAPYNPHYGKNGDFIYASHVEIDKEKNLIYGAMGTRKNKIYYERYNQGQTQYRERRLSFNPDFLMMIKKIIEFV